MSWKKKLAIFIMGVTMILCAAGGFWLGVHFIAPARQYRQAEDSVAEDQYDEAIVVFTEIAENYDTGTWLAGVLGFADAADRVTQTTYEKAVYLREQGEYEASAELFDELGEYADSAGQASNSRLLLAEELISGSAFEEALELLASLDGYDGGEFGSAQELTDKAYYTRAGKLAAIGKLEDAEADYAMAESYGDAWENLREVRYNLARNALLLSEYDTAVQYLQKIPTYEDAAELLTILESAVDKVYQTVYTDVSGNIIEGFTSYLWVHSVIVPGRLDEGVSVEMLEDMVVGEEPDPAFFGAISTTYALEMVRDEETWYFTYYGSDTEDSAGALVLEAEFADGYTSLTTRKVYAAVRDAEAAEDAAEVQILEDEENLAEGEFGQEEEGDSAEDTDEGESSGGEADEGSDEESDKESDGESDEKESGEEPDEKSDGESDEGEENAGADSDDEEESSGSGQKESVDPDGDAEEEDVDTDESEEDESGDEETGEEDSGEEDSRSPANAYERTWVEVTDEDLAELIRECFRTRIRLELAENGNMAFNNCTSDARLSHYCDVAYCLNKGVYIAEDSTSRRYYCEEHYEEYLADPILTGEDSAEEDDSEEEEDA